MKFDKNKNYKTKSGLDFEYVNTDTSIYPINGCVVYPYGTKKEMCYTKEGKYDINNNESELDLVEVEQGIDLSKVKTCVNGHRVRKLHKFEGNIYGQRRAGGLGWVGEVWSLQGEPLDGDPYCNLKVEVEEEIVYLEVYSHITIEQNSLKDLQKSISSNPQDEIIAAIKWNKTTGEKELMNLE